MRMASFNTMLLQAVCVCVVVMGKIFTAHNVVCVRVECKLTFLGLRAQVELCKTVFLGTFIKPANLEFLHTIILDLVSYDRTRQNNIKWKMQ